MTHGLQQFVNPDHPRDVGQLATHHGRTSDLTTAAAAAAVACGLNDQRALIRMIPVDDRSAVDDD